MAAEIRADGQCYAVFVDGKDQFPEVVERYIRLFDRHVEEGRFVRRDHFQQPTQDRKFTLHRILFSLPEEVWRIDEMIELKTAQSWSIEHERREGELLGYETWMNDHYLKMTYPPGREDR